MLRVLLHPREWSARAHSAIRFVHTRAQQSWKKITGQTRDSSSSNNNGNASAAPTLPTHGTADPHAPSFCSRLCALPKRVAPLFLWILPWQPLLLHLLLLLVYAALVHDGVLLYRAGIEFSYGGSSFGQQIACVAASAACLICASITASATDEVALRWPTHGGGASSADEQAQARREKQAAEDAKSAAAVPLEAAGQPLLLEEGGSADSPLGQAARDQKIYGDKTLATLCYPRLRSWILIPLPLCVPLLLSIRAFSTNAATNTALSAEINIILFSSIGVAVGLVLGMMYLACCKGRGRIVFKIAGPLLASAGLYLFVNYLQAQTAYLRGLVTPSFLFDPRLQLDDSAASKGASALWASNPILAGMLHSDYALAGLPSPPPPSVLDSLAEVRRRKEWSACRIEPHWHLADVLPRRAANFFVGSDSCPVHRRFVSWDRSASELTVDCPLAAGDLEIELSPDWISRRTKTQAGSDLQRHYALFVQLENEAREAEPNALPALVSLPSKPSPREIAPAHTLLRNRPDGLARFPTSSHSYLSARCGAHENYFLTHKPDPAITARAQKIMRESLFEREFKERDRAPLEQSRRRVRIREDRKAAIAKGEKPTTEDENAPFAGVPTSPTLLNPPVLMLFVDCVSRSHMLRSMPLTTAVMRRAQHASSVPRAARERIYEAQQTKQAIRKRHRKARDLRRDPDRRQTTPQASDQAELEHAAEEREFMREIKQQDRIIRGRIKQAKAALDATPPLSSPRTPYSVYESSVYHVLDHHTRGNMQAMLCASGHSGWGGSLLEPSGDGVAPGSSAASAFRGRGQQLPPRYTLGHMDFMCPARDLIWNRYKRMGYVTGFVTNDCTDLVSDMVGSGVGRDYSADYEVIAPLCHPEYDHAGVWSNFAGPYSMRRRCIAGRYVHEYSIDYARDFINAYDQPQSPPWFLMLSFVEAHEGSLAVLALLDAALAEFLEWVLTALSTPPVIVFVSDHGSHMGPFTEFTRGGSVEHKLPALVTLVPEPWIAHWDVVHKAAALDAIERKAVVKNAQATGEDARYFTLHPDVQSTQPISAYPLALLGLHAAVAPKAAESSTDAAAAVSARLQPPFAPNAPSVRQSSLLDTSLGLALHQNRWSLVTAREVYWFLREIPARVVADAELVADRGREAKWLQARQSDAEEQVQAMAMMLRRDPQGGAFLSPRRAQALAFHALAAPLDLDVDAFVRLTRAGSNATSVVGPYGEAVSGAVIVREAKPLSLSSYIVADRRCDQAGILDSLCICNQGEH